MPTPWAPSQHKDMNCACRHWDALECSRLRVPAGYDLDCLDDDYDDRCSCCCHDRDDDEDYDTDDPRYWTD